MGHTDDLLDGLAQTLTAAGVAKYPGPYVADDTAIGLNGLPQQCDIAVAITDYGTSDDYPDQALTTIRVQLRFRGRPNDRKSMLDLRDAAYYALQNLTNEVMGTAFLIQCLRISSVPLGQDDLDRWEMTDNYSIDLQTPATTARH